jgi:DNA-binding XRE family transcriptional regulator
MTLQIIKQNDKPEWAVIPYEMYLELVEKAEMFQDFQDYDTAKLAQELGTEELIPAEVIDAILDGENAIKVWREYCGLSQTELATSAGISVPYLSQLETNKREGSLRVLSALAEALNVTLDLIT